MALGPFFVGERIPFTVTVKDKDTGTALNLTNYTVPKCMLRKSGSAANKFTTPTDEDAVISDAVAGKITYTMPTEWLAADVGQWTLQVQLTTPVTLLPRKTEKIGFRVESAITPS